MKKDAPQYIDSFLEFSKGINVSFFNNLISSEINFFFRLQLVIEKSSDNLIVKYFPDLIESFLMILTSTRITDKLIDFLYIIHEMGIYIPDETKRFSFIELEHLL